MHNRSIVSLAAMVAGASMLVGPHAPMRPLNAPPAQKTPRTRPPSGGKPPTNGSREVARRLRRMKNAAE